MNIQIENGPGGQCPVQAEGKIDGLNFYFRARHQGWALYIAKHPSGDPLGKNAIRHEEHYNGKAHDAGHALPEECIAFIKKAGEIILQQMAEKKAQPPENLEDLLTEIPQLLGDLKTQLPEKTLDELQAEAWKLVHEEKAILGKDWKLSATK